MDMMHVVPPSSLRDPDVPENRLVRIYTAHGHLGTISRALRMRSPESVAARPEQPQCVTVGAIDSRVIAILDTPPSPGEPIECAFRRKEHELRALFGELSAVEARALHRRLMLASPDDALAAKFARLAAERRGRLLAFLEAAPRREALSHRRRH